MTKNEETILNTLVKTAADTAGIAALVAEKRCEIVRRTAITTDMTYEERLAAQRRRYGL